MLDILDLTPIAQQKKPLSQNGDVGASSTEARQ
nr:MAG TPA: hypothetical protein [Bacteriophage sp.]